MHDLHGIKEFFSQIPDLLHIDKRLRHLYMDGSSLDWRGRRVFTDTNLSEEKRLMAKANDPDFLRSRKETAERFKDICQSLEKASLWKADDFVVMTRDVVRDVCGNRNNEKLFAHIQETQDAAREFLEKLPEEILTRRQKELLVEVVAPLHDLFKALGDTNQPRFANETHHQRVKLLVWRKRYESSPPLAV